MCPKNKGLENLKHIKYRIIYRIFTYRIKSLSQISYHIVESTSGNIISPTVSVTKIYIWRKYVARGIFDPRSTYIYMKTKIASPREETPLGDASSIFAPYTDTREKYTHTSRSQKRYLTPILRTSEPPRANRVSPFTKTFFPTKNINIRR